MFLSYPAPLCYALARCQKQFSPKVGHKRKAKEKLQQFTFYGWLIMDGGESEKKKNARLKLHSI